MLILVIALIVAIFLYPFLHEAGHVIAAFVTGMEVLEMHVLPLPFVVCRMEGIQRWCVISVGFAGMLFPYLLTLCKAPKHFWSWYVWILLKSINLMAFLISLAAIMMCLIGIPLEHEDITKVMEIVPEYYGFYCMFFVISALFEVIQMVRSEPLKRCRKEFEQ